MQFFAAQAELTSTHTQMATASLDKHDLQQTSQLQEQLQKALLDQQATTSSLKAELQNQEQKLSIRYGFAIGVQHECIAASRYIGTQCHSHQLQLFFQDGSAALCYGSQWQLSITMFDSA